MALCQVSTITPPRLHKQNHSAIKSKKDGTCNRYLITEFFLPAHFRNPKVNITCNLYLPHGGLMQHPSIHTYGEYHPVVGKPLTQRFRACPALACLLVFLCQDQDEFCPGGNTQDI